MNHLHTFRAIKKENYDNNATIKNPLSAENVIICDPLHLGD